MEKESGEGKEKGEAKDKEKPDSKEKEKEKESADDPQFVKDLLALHDKFINVVNSEFCGNALFQKALKDAFVEVRRTTDRLSSTDTLSPCSILRCVALRDIPCKFLKTSYDRRHTVFKIPFHRCHPPHQLIHYATCNDAALYSSGG